MRALVAPVLALLPLASCACPTAPPARACVELEAPPDNTFFAGVVPEAIAGAIVDDEGFNAGTFFCAGPLAHSVTLDAGNGTRARFSWDHDELDLDVALVGDSVAIDQITPTDFEGTSSSFVIHDDDGIALVVDGATTIDDVGALRVEHGMWRGSTPTACGLATSTGVRVVPDEGASHDLGPGDDVVVSVEGRDVRVHAFGAMVFGPWACTDTSNFVSWALVREPS